MKWYSVKKYKPPFCDMELFVYAGGTTIKAECCGMSDGSFSFTDVEDDLLIKDVTHFCIPDPIEIEE